MWQRDEFLAQARAADREREACESARIHGLVAGEYLPSLARPGLGPSIRRATASVFAASGRAAIWVARQIDTGVDAEAPRVAH